MPLLEFNGQNQPPPPFRSNGNFMNLHRKAFYTKVRIFLYGKIYPQLNIYRGVQGLGLGEGF